MRAKTPSPEIEAPGRAFFIPVLDGPSDQEAEIAPIGNQFHFW